MRPSSAARCRSIGSQDEIGEEVMNRTVFSLVGAMMITAVGTPAANADGHESMVYVVHGIPGQDLGLEPDPDAPASGARGARGALRRPRRGVGRERSGEEDGRGGPRLPRAGLPRRVIKTDIVRCIVPHCRGRKRLSGCYCGTAPTSTRQGTVATGR